MLKKVNGEKFDISRLLELFPEKHSLRLTARILDESLVIFYVTGSVADGCKNPGDLDVFSASSRGLMNILNEMGFWRDFSYYKDPWVCSVWGKSDVHIQVIEGWYFDDKLELMKDFHLLMNSKLIFGNYPCKANRRLVLQNMRRKY